MSGTENVPRGAAPQVAPPPPAPAAALPLRGLPRAPSAGRVWSRALVLLGVGVGFWALDQIANVFMDLWLLQSLGYEDVFWTNFRVQAALFAIALGLLTAAIAAPAFVNRLSRGAKRRAVGIGVLAGVVLGAGLASRYSEFLLLFEGHSFGRTDPVFDNDIGFYVFDLPAIKTIVHALEDLAIVGLIASVVGAALSPREDLRPAGLGRVRRVLGRVAHPLTLGWVGVLGVAVAADIWLNRYDLLTRDNVDSGLPNGAQVLDVTGFFSTNNLFWVETVAELLLTAGVIGILLSLRRAVTRPGATGWQRRTRPRRLALALLPGLVVTILFTIGVSLRDDLEVQPNEPVVQLPFIKRHIDATNTAYGMDKIEVRQFRPNGPGDPKPKLDDLLGSAAVRNAPLWPGYHATLERQVDPEYLNRILLKAGDPTIYGPTMQTYQQLQKLRPYYDFMDIDTVRYNVQGEDGPEPRLFASAVRELPLVEPQPWLAWWGQRFMLFTHGSGLVMNLLAGVSPEGYPQFASRDIPSRVDDPALAVENPAVYYGEGAGSMAYSNVEDIKEHDYPTEEGRQEIAYPQDVNAGVELDSPLKRAVFGWKSRQFMEIFFSDLIHGESRVHYFRTPLERLEAVAPFLWGDTDPYAVTAGDRIHWMVNGLTHSNAYPYSMRQELGDKAYVRTPTPRDTRWVNYVQDSVKATVDGFTGQVNLYKWKDEPVVDTWADVYPDLFKSRDAMPPRLAEQVQYPVQLMHIQFDDTFIYSHMTDPLTYFSQEDLFDDGDEVKGPVIEGLEGEPLNFSIEPYYWMAETGKGPLPRSAPPTQFAMSTIFTPENALNLRAVITAYQEGRDYGRLSMAVVPKGEFHPGPEQADAAIDQDPFISQQIGLWSRRGLEVIRGHTTPLIVENEMLYVEPLFVRSVQNPVPQLERVIVVFRGDAFMGRTLEEALREAVIGRARFPIRPGPELGGEPGFSPNGDRIYGPGEAARPAPLSETPRTPGEETTGGRPADAGPRG
ncbi:MAG TPA: UPF0182 family protein [Solirubrobacteraceae bacterium]|jgi:hypothetical protein|nr:UPF0182 family protein [Solirubrobacteraceae bacterium]